MNLWIDCEWNGPRGVLLSMALVGEEGQEWYEVLQTPSNVDPWVRENVIPKLDKAPVSLKEMQRSLTSFLRPWQFVNITADWPEDIARFCELLIAGPGLRIDTPPLTMKVIRLDSFSENPHNALADARALRLADLGE